jgi:flagellin
MASILTNASALTALQTLKSVSGSLAQTQDRISTGLKVANAKDNAAYYAIAATMKGDVADFDSINENLTLTKNSVTVARTGAEGIADIVKQVSERVSFSLSTSVNHDQIQNEIKDLVGQAKAILDQSSFNGETLLNGPGSGAGSTVIVSTGVTRSGGSYAVTQFTFSKQDLATLVTNLGTVDISDATATNTTATRQASLVTVQGYLKSATDSATALGLAEKTIGQQQSFVSKLVDQLNTGVGAMIDADMNQESTKLQALQVQQQLATQALQIANQQPQSILALFRG